MRELAVRAGRGGDGVELGAQVTDEVVELVGEAGVGDDGDGEHAGVREDPERHPHVAAGAADGDELVDGPAEEPDPRVRPAEVGHEGVHHVLVVGDPPQDADGGERAEEGSEQRRGRPPGLLLAGPSDGADRLHPPARRAAAKKAPAKVAKKAAKKAPAKKAKKAAKKATNLSVNSDLLRRARELDVNLSAVLEEALLAVVKRRLAERWLADNRKAIAAYNEQVEAHGVFSDGVRGF